MIFTSSAVRSPIGSGNDGAAQGDDRNVRGTAADVDNHIAAGTGNVDASSNGSRDGLLDDVDFPGACTVSGILNGPLLDFGDTRRHADRNPGLPIGLLSHGLLDEVLDHLLGHGIVGDNALAKGTDSDDISRSPAQHQTGFLTYCLDLVAVPVKSDNRGFLQDNAPSLDIDEDAGGTQVDSYIVRTHETHDKSILSKPIAR